MTSTATRIEQEVEHRPWPLPGVPWVMFQSWRQLLFAHWRVPYDVLRPLVPAELVLEEFDDTAWVGLTPFKMTGVRPRLLPAVPGVSEFPEMNLRTYVKRGDRPGIFFFSLDAGSELAVKAARAVYRLPYYTARMSINPDGEWIRYSSHREGGADFVGRYRPIGSTFEASPGSLEHFLVERYALYTVLRDGKVLRGEIHHLPWRLRAAEAVIERNTVALAQGVPGPGDPLLLHYAARQDTLVWAPVVDEYDGAH